MTSWAPWQSPSERSTGSSWSGDRSPACEPVRRSGRPGTRGRSRSSALRIAAPTTVLRCRNNCSPEHGKPTASRSVRTTRSTRSDWMSTSGCRPLGSISTPGRSCWRTVTNCHTTASSLRRAHIHVDYLASPKPPTYTSCERSTTPCGCGTRSVATTPRSWSSAPGLSGSKLRRPRGAPARR